MYKKAAIFALALVGADAFAPMGASPPMALKARVSTSRQTLVMGTFVEEFKFRKIANRFTFKTFADCIEQAGMAGELNGNTVLAPTDAAFEELGAADLAAIMADKAKLTGMVKFHILPGAQDGPSFRSDNGKQLATLQGGSRTVNVDPAVDRFTYLDQAKVETFDIETDEGSFHIIDWFDMPKA